MSINEVSSFVVALINFIDPMRRSLASPTYIVDKSSYCKKKSTRANWDKDFFHYLILITWTCSKKMISFEKVQELWSAICFKIMTRYACGFFPSILASFLLYDIRAFFVTDNCVSFPSIWPFSYKRAYICAQKTPYICVTNKHVVYAAAESRHIRGTELYRQQKTPSCTMELKSNLIWIKHGCNARVNVEQDFFLIHCPHSSGGC